MITFIIFGFMDNFILILSMYFSYCSIEYYLERYFENIKADPILLACISAGLGNTFSDAIGFAVSLNFAYMGWTIAGCLLGMLIIPVMQLIKKIRG